MRAEFAMTKAELEKKLVQTCRDYKPQEFGEWEQRAALSNREVTRWVETPPA
jgi:hypothetical protein